MKPGRASLVMLLAFVACSAALAAPGYLIDARGWDGQGDARLVARAVPELVREEAWSGKVEVKGGQLLEVRLRSREGKRTVSGVTLEGAAFEVEAGQPMHDLAVEFEGSARTTLSVTLAGESVSATVGELLKDDRELTLKGGGTVRLLLTFIYPPDEPAPITNLKPLYPRTELLVGGKAMCAIAVPADGRHDAIARQLAQALAARGAAPEIVKAEDLMDEHLQPNAQALSASHVIAIGNVLDNRLVGGLWGRGYALASALYPGPEGYVIRTIHDPFGLGRNVLLLPDGIRLTQDDQQMRVATDGEGILDLTRVPFARDEEWHLVGIEDTAAKVLRQDKVADLAAEETMRFATGLCAQPTEGASRFEVARLAEGAAAVALGDECWLAASGPFEAQGVSFNGELALIGTDRLVVAAGTALSLAGEQVLAAEAPVSLEADLAQGTAVVQAGPVATSFTWRGKAVRVEAGEGLQQVDLAMESIAGSLRAVTQLADAALEAKRALASATPEPQYTKIESVGAVELEAPASYLAPAGEGLFVGSLDGSVVCLDRDLHAQWRWQAEGPICALASADLDGDGDPEFIVGSEDHYVYALRAGEVLWKFEIRASTCWVHGPRQAKMILPADLDVDGSPEILIAGEYVHCLRSDGSLAWEDYLMFWRGMYRTNCQVVSAADVNSDGKLEVIVSFYDPYSLTRTLSHEGKPLMQRPEGFYHHVPAGNLGVDLDGDGRGEIIIAQNDGLKFAPFDTGAKYGGITMWGNPSIRCGSVLHLRLGRSGEHDPLILATNDTCDVRGVYHRTADSGYRLREAWRLNLREAITAAAVFDLDDDGLTEIIVGTKRGNVKVVSSEGELLAAADAFRGAVNDLVIMPGRGGPEIAVARQDGTVERLRLRLDL